MVKVIASSLRKGNVVEQDNNLHVVLTAENVHPGKGNSVTNVTMRRISDGVKVIGRWRTVEMVEKADDFHAVRHAAHGDVGHRVALAGVDVLGKQHHVQLAVLLDDVALAERRGDDFDHYFFLVAAPEGA